MNPNFIIKYRILGILAFNLILTSIGWILSLCLRFDFDPVESLDRGRIVVPLLTLLAWRQWCYMYFDLNRGYWRYSSVKDLIDLVKAHGLSTACFSASMLLLRVPNVPRSAIATEFAISLLLSGGGRLAVRVFAERFQQSQRGFLGGAVRDVIVIGAGDTGHLLVKMLLNTPRLAYRPIAILDDAERFRGGSVLGIPIVGPLSSLGETLKNERSVAGVIVAIPSLSRERMELINQVCKREEVQCKRLQSFEDIACVDSSIDYEPRSIEVALEKEVHVEHEQQIRQALEGKVVLVTGAGGSIGSELFRQLIPFGLRRLVAYDNSELNMFQLERQLNRHPLRQSMSFILGSVVDESRLARVFSEVKPEIVFHAAAYKHVPLMETNASQAVLNNIIGTRNVLAASKIFGTQRFVLISTDKAVDPSNVMGATKRIAELLVRSSSVVKGSKMLQRAETVDSGEALPTLATAVVRFGNVINSSGSVIPIFKEQILSGGPITVTHPEMLRFFMSIREAVRLVLTAGVLGEAGEIYLLDMGKPMRVLDVAKKMLALYGRRDIKIVFSGMRPGEKLTEALTGRFEQRAATNFTKVSRVSSENYELDLTMISGWVDELERDLPTLRDSDVRDRLLHLFSSELEQASSPLVAYSAASDQGPAA